MLDGFQLGSLLAGTTLAAGRGVGAPERSGERGDRFGAATKSNHLLRYHSSLKGPVVQTPLNTTWKETQI